MAIEETRRSPRLTKKRDVDMTQGNAIMHIIRFAIPLLAETDEATAMAAQLRVVF